MKLVLALVAVAAICWYFLTAEPQVTVDVARAIATPSQPAVKPAPPPPAPLVAASSARVAAAVRPAPASESNDLPQIVLENALGPNNLFHDDLLGFSMTFPAGWQVAGARRWGTNNHQNTVTFRPPTDSTAAPSMYYKLYVDQPPIDAATAEAYLRKQAQEKEAARNLGGGSDYKNLPESFAFTTINGNPALSYFATFTQDGEVMTEYFVRVLGPKGYVMFFANGKLEDVKTIMPQVKQMASTLKVP